jgi:molybdopterin converting factor small subunit
MTVHLKVFATLAEKLTETLKDQYPAGFKPGSAIELEIPEKSSIGGLLDRLDLKDKGGLLVFVNGKAQQDSYKIDEGDQIGIFPPIGGGAG